MSLKRARNDPSALVGLVRKIDVIGGVASPVHDELRRMMVSKYALQKSGWVCDITISEIIEWILDGPESTPKIILDYCERPMTWTGLEQTNEILSPDDKRVMSNVISSLMQGSYFSGDVDLSIQQGELRMMTGRKKIGSIVAFLHGKCNMTLSQTITCEDGTLVDEISWAMLPTEQKRHFTSLSVSIFLFHRLTVENEATIVAANWDGFFDAP